MKTSLSFNHLISAHQLSIDDIMLLCKQALEIKENPQKKSLQFKSPKILASLFFEPSTRTRFSFESAMIKLGGNYINLENSNSASTSKGESLEDMGKIISAYADIIVMRHPDSGSVSKFSTYADVPVINGGDGPHEHPSQSLTDLTTILENKKRLSELNIGFFGDLKYARTTNSLIKLLTTFKDNHFTFISSKELRINDTLRVFLKDKNQHFLEHNSLEDVIADLDILYVTRTQLERTKKETISTISPITINSLKAAKKELIILHPLPRVTELDTSVDSHPSAKYFEQANNGLYLRMALLKNLLSDTKT